MFIKLIVPILIITSFTSIYLLFLNDPTPQNEKSINTSQAEDKPTEGAIKTLSGAEFRKLYDSIAYPNTAYISEKYPITADEGADTRIRELAEVRGYKQRSAPVNNNLKNVGQNMLLQHRAAVSWSNLKTAAKKDGFKLTLTASYRSAKTQKDIFLKRLGKISTNDILSGKYDRNISNILRTTAIPGYSRHHTGYTIDVACANDPYVLFEKTTCFRWLSDDNYKNAKLQGWIPSYPDGAGPQGPDPEAWEYVWVGKQVLTE